MRICLDMTMPAPIPWAENGKEESSTAGRLSAGPLGLGWGCKMRTRRDADAVASKPWVRVWVWRGRHRHCRKRRGELVVGGAYCLLHAYSVLRPALFISPAIADLDRAKLKSAIHAPRISVECRRSRPQTAQLGGGHGQAGRLAAVAPMRAQLIGSDRAWLFLFLFPSL